jgi:hypothetical protein
MLFVNYPVGIDTPRHFFDNLTNKIKRLDFDVESPLRPQQRKRAAPLTSYGSSLVLVA